MSESIRYMVVCDHPEMNRRYFVADINDDRPSGGQVRFDLYHGVLSAYARSINRRGDYWTVIPFTCGAPGCDLNVELRQSSLAELLDKIGPRRDALFTVESFPIYEQPTVAEVEAHIFDDVDEGHGTIIGHEQRYVIQLSSREGGRPPGLCELVQQLRDRRKP